MPKAESPLKKQQKPLVVWFRLYGLDKAAMESVSGNRRGAHNAVAMAGTLAEIARLQAAAVPVTPKELKAIAAFKKVTHGADIIPVLSAAMRDSVLREAALGTCAHPSIPSSTGPAPVVVRHRRTA